MAYVPLSTIGTGDTIATAWGNQVKDNFAAGVPDIFTTKGDIAVASAADAAARLAVGSDFQILHSKASATNGVEWTSGAYCHVYINTQSINDNTTTRMQPSAVLSDSYSMWDGTNFRITLPAGFPNRLYRVTAQGYWTATGTTATYRHVEIRKNNTIIARQSQVGDTLTQAIGICCSVPYLATAADYFDVWVNQRSGGALAFNEFYFTLEMVR